MAGKLSVDQQLLLLGFLLTLANLAKTIHDSSRVYLLQQSLCFNYYLDFDASKIDQQSQIEESLCKRREIQAPLSVADGIESFLRHLPGKWEIFYSSYRPCMPYWDSSSGRFLWLILILQAFLVMATYKEFLAVVGLRRLLLLNFGCSALGVLYSIANCTQQLSSVL